MARFVRGDVVVIPFPFSDLTQTKRRPALVLKDLPGEDLILCQITSQMVRNAAAIEINLTDFQQGSLNQLSNVRPDRLFTADEGLILYKAGSLKAEKMIEILTKVRDLFI
jgi:mRNA interferase MazF